MGSQAEALLATFDALDPAERQEVATEILRRAAANDELTDEALAQAGAAVFRMYDEEEAGSDQD